jgi:hypothetical protein
MGGLRTIRDELIGLFVDDGSFAAAILAWLVGGFICLRLLQVPPEVEAIVLALGFGLLLAENVIRSARGAGRS